MTVKQKKEFERIKRKYSKDSYTPYAKEGNIKLSRFLSTASQSDGCKKTK